MSPGSRKPRPPRCPGCGYDLTGQRDAKPDRCPLFSVCPECGEEVSWSRGVSVNAWGDSPNGTRLGWLIVIATVGVMLLIACGCPAFMLVASWWSEGG